MAEMRRGCVQIMRTFWPAAQHSSRTYCGTCGGAQMGVEVDGEQSSEDSPGYTFGKFKSTITLKLQLLGCIALRVPIVLWLPSGTPLPA